VISVSEACSRTGRPNGESEIGGGPGAMAPSWRPVGISCTETATDRLKNDQTAALADRAKGEGSLHEVRRSPSQPYGRQLLRALSLERQRSFTGASAPL